MSALAILFGAVFVAQVVLISIYIPNRFRRRLEHVFQAYPPDHYPKLYPTLRSVEIGRAWLRAYWLSHVAVACVGVGLIALAVAKGFELDPRGGAEAIVLAFFAVQMIPHMVAAVTTNWFYDLMRRTSVSPVRSASLTPRRLFDYVSPAWVFAAILTYLTWAAVYIGQLSIADVFEARVWITLVGVTLINGLFARHAMKALHDRPGIPHQPDAERDAKIASAIRVAAFSSIAMCGFLILIDAVRILSLDVIEPMLTSLYLQFVTALGIGATLDEFDDESVDFDVYKADGAVPLT